MSGSARWRYMTGIFWACLVLGGLLLPAGAVEVIQGPEVEVAPSGTRAELRWRTDVECGTRARYGLKADQLDQKVGEGVAVDHSVILENLEPGRTYYYSVGTARAPLKQGTFATGMASKPATAEKPLPPGKPKVEAPAAPRAPPPAKVTWGYLPSLEDHFERHGQDFRATSKEDYARQAWEFLQRAMAEGLPAKMDDSDGTIRVYDPKSGAFAAYNRNGTTKTYFKPGGSGYWDRQPGRSVRLRRS